MSNKSNIPGFILYADREALFKAIGPTETGKVILYAINYFKGETANISDLDLSEAGIVVLLQLYSDIDRSIASYKEKSNNAKYAVYCREAYRTNSTPMSREEWEEESGF